MAFMNSFDGFIFDYGKVLVTDQTSAERSRMAKIVGIPVDFFEELYWKDRRDYDKGLLTAPEYWEALAKQAGELLDTESIKALSRIDVQSWMHFDEPMWNFVRKLRSSGKRAAMLSNMPRDLGTVLRTDTDRFHNFDHVTLSYEVKSVKPEAAVYEECLAGLGTEKRKTIFFDDKIANVKGAEMLGLHAMEFSDRNEFFQKMLA